MINGFRDGSELTDSLAQCFNSRVSPSFVLIAEIEFEFNC